MENKREMDKGYRRTVWTIIALFFIAFIFIVFKIGDWLDWAWFERLMGRAIPR